MRTAEQTGPSLAGFLSLCSMPSLAFLLSFVHLFPVPSFPYSLASRFFIPKSPISSSVFLSPKPCHMHYSGVERAC